MYTNRPQHIQMTKVLNSGMSDHLPVCLVRKYQKHRSIQKCKKTIRYRRWKHFNDLEKAPWNVLDTYDDPDDAIDFFNRTFLYVAGHHAPLVIRRVKRQRQPPWMTPIIYRQILQRDRLLKQARELDTLKVWQQYKEQTLWESKEQ